MNACHYIIIKELKIDKVLHFAEADVKRTRVLSPPLSSFPFFPYNQTPLIYRLFLLCLFQQSNKNNPLFV